MFACFKRPLPKTIENPPISFLPCARFVAKDGDLIHYNTLFKDKYPNIYNINNLRDDLLDSIKFHGLIQMNKENTCATFHLSPCKRFIDAVFVEIIQDPSIHSYERTLSYLFPKHVIDSMSDSGRLNKVAPRYHEQVVVLFMDLVGYTAVCSTTSPVTVVDFLNKLFTKLDECANLHDVYKLETVGDCYVAVTGLVAYNEYIQKASCTIASRSNNTMYERMIEFAFDAVQTVKTEVMQGMKEPFKVRVGIHTGPVTSGVIGNKMPRFSLFGDTMNTASRMESTCEPDNIQISESLYDKLSPNLRQQFEKQNKPIQVKGKGLMTTYLRTKTKFTIHRLDLDELLRHEM